MTVRDEAMMTVGTVMTGRGDDDDDDDDGQDSRSFRFNDDNRNLRRLLDSLLLQERDNDDDKQEINVEPKTYEGYGLKGEDEKSNEDFNFAAAGDFGCSENAKNTIKNMEDSNPELVLPLGDLSYQSTANCWVDR